MEKFFSHSEIEKFKKGSFNFPLIIYDGTEKENVTEVIEVIVLSGMADNGGIPKKIRMTRHVKGEPLKHLTYTLTEQTDTL